jgi:integrase
MEISFYLKRANVLQETSIFARICYSGFKLKYYTTEKINPQFWNSKTQRAEREMGLRNYASFNQRLDDLTSEIRTIYRYYLKDNGNQIPEPEILKRVLDAEIKKVAPAKDQLRTLLGFFEELINQTVSGGRVQPNTGKPYSPATVQVYRNTLQRLNKFQSTRKRIIDFTTIDLDFYTDFTEYLSRHLKLSTNTIGKDIKTLKTVLNEATERGINTNLQFKSRRFSTTSEQTDSIYLTERELKEMEALDLKGNTRQENVRDLFLIGCYTGLRYSDFSIIKPEQIKDGYIELKEQTKTGNPVIIPVHATVNRILEKYNGQLPKSISNQKTNSYLKEIGRLMPSLQMNFSRAITKGGVKVMTNYQKWELLSTHTARRSFATNEYLNGTPTITIMAITGHRTEKAFLRYIKLTPKEHAKLLQAQWEKRSLMSAV